MSLDKFIRIKLTELSEKYNITIIEITVARSKKVSKIFKVNMQPLKDEDDCITDEFSSKRSLASWLLCQH